MNEQPQIRIDCPVPIADLERIQLAHGEGARLTRRLIRDEILTAFANPILAPLADAALLPDLGGRLVMTTDSFVVNPLFFPGGDIGSLAVHGTINDLAVSGAEPLYLSVALILEEGLPIATLRRVIYSMSKVARESGVAIVTGDTKVVPHGDADKVFICTTGVGRLRPGVDLGTHRVRPGDRILISGAIGDHGLAILGEREGFEFSDQLRSDTAPLHGLVSALFNSGADVHFLRDPTRGGVAAVMHELVEQSGLTVRLNEASLPVAPCTRGACELLGLDPLFIANEGKLVVVLPKNDAETAMNALRSHPFGENAADIGELIAESAPNVLLINLFGQLRVIDEPSGAPLPRIC